jgi:arylsulfatase
MTLTKPIFIALSAALVLVSQGSTCDAQTAPTSSNGQTVLPYEEPYFRGNVGTTFKDSDPAAFPKAVKAPQGAPNVLLVLLDDVGFGEFSVSGGGVPSPNMEKLANEGLFYNRFHTTALCSPTRAALLTGRNHQVSGTGIITELATLRWLYRHHS